MSFHRVAAIMISVRKTCKEWYKEQGNSMMNLSPFTYQAAVYEELFGEPAPGKKAVMKALIQAWLENHPFFLSERTTFYQQRAWIELKARVLDHYGEKCMICGITETICVDHIIPRSVNSRFELDFDNLQVLCRSCNSSKGTKTWDFRDKENAPKVVTPNLIKMGKATPRLGSKQYDDTVDKLIKQMTAAKKRAVAKEK